MTLLAAGGAEEAHTSQGNAVGVGPWSSSTLIAIAGTCYTGTYAFAFKHLASGSSSHEHDQGTGYYSFAHYAPTWGNGTWRYLWNLGAGGGDSVYFRLIKGSTTGKYKFQIVSAAGTTTCTNEATTGEWNLFKIQFDSGVWKVWKNYNGAGWDAIDSPELTKDDSGTYTELSLLRLEPSNSSDETKVANQIHLVDDCLCWDSQGDNWNSLIPVAAFPRISVAHMPIANGEWDDLDEIPPGADKPAADDDEAYYDCESLKNAPEDYTAETIQAVMITRVDGAVAAEQANFSKFNLYDSGDSTLYTDSEEGGRRVQFGTDGAATPWWTIAGYYPWTPGGKQNWTWDLFNSCQYGCYVLTAYTTQVTAQAIYFGSSHEWPAPTAGFPHSQAAII